MYETGIVQNQLSLSHFVHFAPIQNGIARYAAVLGSQQHPGLHYMFRIPFDTGVRYTRQLKSVETHYRQTRTELRTLYSYVYFKNF